MIYHTYYLTILSRSKGLYNFKIPIIKPTFLYEKRATKIYKSASKIVINSCKTIKTSSLARVHGRLGTGKEPTRECRLPHCRHWEGAREGEAEVLQHHGEHDLGLDERVHLADEVARARRER